MCMRIDAAGHDERTAASMTSAPLGAAIFAATSTIFPPENKHVRLLAVIMIHHRAAMRMVFDMEERLPILVQ